MTIQTPPRRTLGGPGIRLPGPAPTELAGAAPERLPRPVHRNKRPEDTAAGCRANAEADRTRAATPGSEHFRGRLEQSAAAWTARADLLDEETAKFGARRLRKRA